MIRRLLVTWQHPEDALLDDGAILVNARGERFCDETLWPQREIAIALGLFRDEPSIAALVARVKADRSEYSRMNAALALGRIGTPAAGSVMVDLLVNGSLSGPTRSQVAGALGQALDTRPVPTLYPLTEDFDYDLTLDTFHRLMHRL